MGLISKTRKSRVMICFTFLTINFFFEIGQKYKTLATKYIPNYFNRLFILENSKNYFSLGTFAVSDLISILLGSIMALIIAEIIVERWDNNLKKVKI